MIGDTRAVRWILLIAFLFSVLAISSTFFSSCSGDNSTGSENEPPKTGNTIGPEGGQVVSDDGLLTLKIPEGALQDVQPIEVKKIETEGLEDLIGLQIHLAYELRPDGLTFDVPINYEITVPVGIETEPGKISILERSVWLVSGEEYEATTNEKTEINLSDQTITIQGSFEHFSTFTVSNKFYAVEVEYPERLCKGEEGQITLRVINLYELTTDITNIEPPSVLISHRGYEGEKVNRLDFPSTFDGKVEMTLILPTQCDDSLDPDRIRNDIQISFPFKNGDNGRVFSPFGFFPLPSINCEDCPLPAPKLIYPEDNATAVETNLMLNWNPVEGADWYQVEILEDFNLVTTTDILAPPYLVHLQGGRTYIWKVRAMQGEPLDESSSVAGDWSEEWLFTTLNTSFLNFGDPTICIEPYNSDRYIIWEWPTELENVPEEDYEDVKVSMNVGKPDSENSTSYNWLFSPDFLFLAHIIDDLGTYTFDITEVDYNGQKLGIKGDHTSGSIEVTEDDKNVGQCDGQ